MIALLCAAVFDLILSGARVMDGSGAPWFRADVGIRGDTIAAVGDLSRGKARRRIQLKDLALAPGFIDLLGQSELNALIDPREESKVRQGITTARPDECRLDPRARAVVAQIPAQDRLDGPFRLLPPAAKDPAEHQ